MLIRFLKRALGISKLERRIELMAQGNAILIEIVTKYIPSHIIDYTDYDRLNTARRLSDGVFGAGPIPTPSAESTTTAIKEMWLSQLKA